MLVVIVMAMVIRRRVPTLVMIVMAMVITRRAPTLVVISARVCKVHWCSLC